MKCLKKDYALPSFCILNNESINEEISEVSKLFASIDQGVDLERIITELEDEANLSKKLLLEHNLYYELFSGGKSKEEFRKYVNLSFEIFNEHVDNLRSNTPTSTSIAALKHYLLKKYIFYTTVEEAWLLDEAFLDFNRNALSHDSYTIIANYINNGNHYSSNVLIDDFFEQGFGELPWSLNNGSIDSLTTNDKNNNCTTVVNWQNHIIEKVKKKEYTIIFYTFW